MKERYFLGIRKEDNMEVYLIKESWDCDWYWGFGYIQTFKKGNLYSHEHFDSLFLKSDIFDSFKDYFLEIVLNNDEIWKLLGYMKEYYVMKDYAELLQYGNHITGQAKNILEDKNKEQNEKEVERINKIILPELFEK